jgi:hypothetical protein
LDAAIYRAVKFIAAAAIRFRFLTHPAAHWRNRPVTMGHVVRSLSGGLDGTAFHHLFRVLRLPVHSSTSSTLLLSDGDMNVT